uniref:Ovule protein n=1 Tax=Macrostomum lignano TaxID=282301 RepID=A0A1I8GMR7_9PLAT
MSHNSSDSQSDILESLSLQLKELNSSSLQLFDASWSSKAAKFKICNQEYPLWKLKLKSCDAIQLFNATSRCSSLRSLESDLISMWAA